MKKISIMTIAVLLVYGAKAQTDQDVLRYSQNNLSGDARFVSMGGALSSVGADFSSLSTNPAGLALYRSGDFIFSPAITIDNLGSTYIDGKEIFDQKTNFNISNVGIAGVVWEGSKLAKNQWRSVSLGFGMNRTNDFNSRSLAKSYVNASRLDDFNILFNDQNATNYTSEPNRDPFYTEPLYQTWLLNWDSIDGGSSILDTFPGGMMQRKAVETSGGISEMVFSAGGNFSDYLYVGATIGVPFLRYHSKAIYYEQDIEDYVPDLNDWTLTEYTDVTGTGVNIKIGAIFRPVDFLRVGLAFHSPTYYSLTENFHTFAQSNTYQGYSYYESPTAEYDYSIQTPAKIIVSAAGIIGKYGIISAEYEFLNYRKMRLRNNDNIDNEVSVNDIIGGSYESTGNLRIGGEVNLAPFKLRAGYQYQGNPHSDMSWSSNTYSVGLGLMLNDGVYLDFAYAYTKTKYTDIMYLSYLYYTPVKINDVKNQVVVTLGMKF